MEEKVGTSLGLYIIPPLEDDQWRKLKTSKITGLQLQLSLVRGCDSAELVEKVGMSNTGIVR
jgi:hypothetical protein